MTLFLMLGAALFAQTVSASPSTGTLAIDGVAAPTEDGMIPIRVSAGDVDGDGVADSGTLLLRCEGASVAEALFHNVKSPRDSASGMASGKRTHVMPHVFETAGPRLSAMRPTYDLKMAKGARMASRKGYDAYQALSLVSADGLCSAATAQAATVKATKSRSNIQNN